jgi:hypothetical protein
MTITVSYSIDHMDTNPTKRVFDDINEAHDWIHDEVSRRVQHVVDHSPYTLSENDIQDIEANEYTLVSMKA